MNVLAIRRHIVADMRGDKSDSEEDYPMDVADTVQSGFVPLSYQKLVSKLKNYLNLLDRLNIL